MANNRSRDEVTVVPSDVYDAMQASLDQPDDSCAALAEAATKAREIVVKAEDPSGGGA